MIRSFSSSFAATLMIGLAAVSAARAEVAQEIDVRIENVSEAPIRCVMVLAHFVTKALPPIPSGHSFTMTLERDPGQGTLSYGSFNDHPMMLENLLCGSLLNWTKTSRDLPILDLRSTEATRFHYRCALVDDRMACLAR